jgi:hypothetical protein
MAEDLGARPAARLLAWGTNAWHVVEFAVAVASGSQPDSRLGKQVSA